MELLYNTGIYKLTFPNGKVYVGQSINIKRRFQVYARMGCRTQKRLYHAIKKYGWNNIKTEILIYVDGNNLDICEKYYIEKYNSTNSKHGYNILKGGFEAERTEEFRKKMLKIGRKRKGIVSKYAGIRQDPSAKTWAVYIGAKSKNIYIGSFEDEESAYIFRNIKIKELDGEILTDEEKLKLSTLLPKGRCRKRYTSLQKGVYKDGDKWVVWVNREYINKYKEEYDAIVMARYKLSEDLSDDQSERLKVLLLQLINKPARKWGKDANIIYICKKWRVRLCRHGKTFHFRSFLSKEEAECAYEAINKKIIDGNLSTYHIKELIQSERNKYKQKYVGYAKDRKKWFVEIPSMKKEFFLEEKDAMNRYHELMKLRV